MTERTALEIALDLDAASCSSFAKLEAAEALRQQHAEIERLSAINSALTAKSNALVDENAWLIEKIGQLTDEKFRRFNNEECWIYQRAGENHLGTLTCPVVISPEALLSMQGEISILTAERDSAVAAECEACAVVCDELAAKFPGTKTGNTLQWAAERIRARLATYEAGMKHHEYRELVNTLTKIAREYGNTQQLRERIAHALPFDCDATDAPSVDDARAMGQQGGPADEAERIAFEAWMIGHNWMPPSVQWTGSIYGSAYRSAAEDGLFIDPEAVRTRMLWAAWRDRAALSKQQSVKIPSNQAQDCS